MITTIREPKPLHAVVDPNLARGRNSRDIGDGRWGVRDKIFRFAMYGFYVIAAVFCVCGFIAEVGFVASIFLLILLTAYALGGWFAAIVWCAFSLMLAFLGIAGIANPEFFNGEGEQDIGPGFPSA